MMLDAVLRTAVSLGPLWATFLLGFTTVVLLFWYSSRKQSYWRNIGIPYVKPLPFLGSVYDASKRPLHDVDFERQKKYGKIYGHFEGIRPLISISDPDILRNILVKDFYAFTGRRQFSTDEKILRKMVSVIGGEDWKRIRTIITPTFTTGKIKRMMGIFKECSQNLVQNFKEAAERGEIIEAKRFYGAFAMDIIASSAFSTKINSLNDPNNPFVQSAKQLFPRNISWRIALFALAPGLLKLFKISPFKPEALNFFQEATLQIIQERKRTGQTRNDFLQLLMDTAKELSDEGKLDLDEKDDIAENYGQEENDKVFNQTTYIKKTLSHEEVIAQCILFFFAGYDTTATTLSLASYNLALNPEIQEKLIEELDDALRAHNGELTYEAIQSMKYLDNVISETLRLYPLATRLERFADQDYKLEDNGITIPKGMMVTIPVYAIHRDPQFYPDPEKFDPDRFTPEERAKRHQFSYLPFGAGPRNCVAMRFALVEIKVCLAYVLSNFRIKRGPETQVPLEFNVGQGLLQPKDINLQFETREDALKAS